MRIIISPAKKMNVDTGSFACHGLPQFLSKTERLYERLRGMSYEAINVSAYVFVEEQVKQERGD